jgi:hypothetical protein
LTNSQEGNGIITLPAGNGEKWAILLPQNALGAGAEGSAYSVDRVFTGARGAVPAIPNNGYLTQGIEVAISTVNNNVYVDLGLPSGLLWATRNVGATTPEGYGDYFAWGETQPKDTYNWSTYRYATGDSNGLTKYCNKSSDGYNGFTDNLTTLLPEDDAAMANWGDGWRMPTQAEFQELIDNTTVTWTTQNGVNGSLFTATNGNSLFLPAAGYHSDSGLDGAGSGGGYWSSLRHTDSPRYAWLLLFNSVICVMSTEPRYEGFTVRPVRAGSQN